MLTAEQRAHFEAFGYLVLRGLFSREEMDEIRGALNRVLLDLRGGAGFSGPAN